MQGCRKQGGWGALAPPVFGQTVNPISTRGADYTHHITTSPPGFSDLATGLHFPGIFPIFKSRDFLVRDLQDLYVAALYVPGPLHIFYVSTFCKRRFVIKEQIVLFRQVDFCWTLHLVN